MKLFVFALISLFLVIGCVQQPGDAPRQNEDRVVVSGFGGQGLLIEECRDKEFISETADYIVEGIVESTETAWNLEQSHIVTSVNFSVEKYVKGQSLGDNIQIENFGGCVGIICEGVEDSPTFQQGKNLRVYFAGDQDKLGIVCAQFGVEEIK